MRMTRRMLQLQSFPCSILLLLGTVVHAFAPIRQVPTTLLSPRSTLFHPQISTTTRIEATSTTTPNNEPVHPVTTPSSSSSSSTTTLLRNGRTGRPTRRITLRRYLAGIVKEKSEVSDWNIDELILMCSSFCC